MRDVPDTSSPAAGTPAYPNEHSDTILVDIHAGLSTYQEPRSVIPRVPSRDDLEFILRTCFFASLASDEDRDIRFRLLFHPGCTPEGVPTYAGGEIVSDWVPFDPPLALTVETLVKVAPATEPRRSCIVVLGEPGAPVIAGLMRHRPGAGPYHYRRVLGLVFLVTGRGELIVASPVKTHMRYARGRANFPRRWEDLDRLVVALQKTFPGLHVTRFMEAMLLILDAVREQGHGGLLLVSPTEAPLAIEAGRYGRVPAAPFLERACELNERLDRNYDAAHARQLQDHVDYEDACAFVGRMTGIDGAVVLTCELKLLGIGCFIGGEEAQVVEPIADAERRPAGQVFTGARHQAAARFCGAQPSGAAAFALSQDGALTVLVKASGEPAVTVFPHVDLR
jgi:hypothetical protein